MLLRAAGLLLLLGLAACQPGPVADQPESGVSNPVSGTGQQPAGFPEASGPVANFFRVDVPASFWGRWASDVTACDSGVDILVIQPNALSSAGMSARLGDIEVNESGGANINIIANGAFTLAGRASDGRAIMALSTDGSRLRFFVMGLPTDMSVPPELVRCS